MRRAPTALVSRSVGHVYGAWILCALSFLLGPIGSIANTTPRHTFIHTMHRAGIVFDIAKLVLDNNGDIQESRMMRMGCDFTLMMCV